MAETLPEGKAAKVKELQESGMIVAMVGMAIGAGTDIAIEADVQFFMKEYDRAMELIRKVSNMMKTTKNY